MPFASRSRFRLALLGLACLLGHGCGGPSGRFTETVEGTVTRGGAPVAGARVQFVPQVKPGDKAIMSSATTDEKGFYRLKRDDNGKPGALLGKHKVVLVAGAGAEGRSRDDNAPDAPVGLQLPPRYNSVTTTPLEVEVKADQKTYALKVE